MLYFFISPVCIDQKSSPAPNLGPDNTWTRKPRKCSSRDRTRAPVLCPAHSPLETACTARQCPRKAKVATTDETPNLSERFGVDSRDLGRRLLYEAPSSRDPMQIRMRPRHDCHSYFPNPRRTFCHLFANIIASARSKATSCVSRVCALGGISGNVREEF